MQLLFLEWCTRSWATALFKLCGAWADFFLVVLLDFIFWKGGMCISGSNQVTKVPLFFRMCIKINSLFLSISLVDTSHRFVWWSDWLLPKSRCQDETKISSTGWQIPVYPKGPRYPVFNVARRQPNFHLSRVCHLSQRITSKACPPPLKPNALVYQMNGWMDR